MANDQPDWYQVAAQGQTLLGTITTAGDGLAHSQTFPLPSAATTQAIALRAWSAGGFFNPATATIKGDVSGVTYILFQAVSANAGSDVERWFLPDVKAVCSVTDQGVGFPAKVDFLALNFGPVVTVRTGVSGPPLSVLTASTGLLDGANASPIRIAQAIVAGAANRVLLQSATASQQIRVFACSIGFDAIAAGSFSLCDGDPNAGGTRRIDFEMGVLNPAPFICPGGAPFLTGNSLYMMVDSNVTARGTVAISIG